MSSGAPLEMVWTGEVLRPTSDAWARRASKEFTAGEVVHVTQHEPRSMASHGHFFASVTEAWKNLPEDLAERFPSPDHLRKYALIRTGWHESRVMTCGSHAAALRLASFVKPMDEFAVVDVPADDSVVTVYTAKTQSFRMGKADFQKSKDDVLGFLSDLLGVERQKLAENAGRAA